MKQANGDSSFLQRWSARKQQLAEQATAAVVDRDAERQSESALIVPTPAQHAPLAPEVPDVLQPESDSRQVSDRDPANAPGSHEGDSASSQAVLTDADMPPIESLDASSDVSVFFSKGVSAELRKAALRFVFRQPQYNIKDGLNDYDGDYTAFEPLGDIITADMKFHTARKERERLEKELQDDLQEETTEELQDDLQEETPEELQDDLQEETPEELQDDLQEETPDEVQDETPEEMQMEPFVASDPADSSHGESSAGERVTSSNVADSD